MTSGTPISDCLPDVPTEGTGLFNSTWEAISRTVVYDAKWANTTGYLDGMFEGDDVIIVSPDDFEITSETHVVVKPGEAVKGIDDKNRKFIFLGTLLGGVVVFERYTPGYGPRVYRIQYHDNFLHLGLIQKEGDAGLEALYTIFGREHDFDLSERIERIYRRIKGEG